MLSLTDLEQLSTKEKQILNRIYREGPVQRTDLQKTCHIKIANFYNIIERLSKNKMIELQGSEVTNAKGRPSEFLVFNYSLFYCICIVLTKSNYYFAITNLKGETLASENHQLSYTSVQFESFLEDINSFYIAMNRKKKFHGKILYCGFVSGLRIEKGIFRDTGNHSWKNIQILKILSEMLGCDVLYNSISQAAAYGMYFNTFRKEADSLVFFNLSRGIGMGIILNNTLLDIGSEERTSIEHMVVDLNGRSCFCGERGCVITSVGTDQIVQNIQARISEQPFETALSLENSLTYETIVQAVKRGDELAVASMEEAARVFSVAIRNINSIFHIPIVVIGGRLCQDNPVFHESLKAHIQSKAPSIRLILEENYISMTTLGISNEIVEHILQI